MRCLTAGIGSLENETFPEEEEWDSVLNAYRYASSNDRPHQVLERLLLCVKSTLEFPNIDLRRLSRKPNVEPLLESLHSILSQPRDHDVSGEVAEAVGYEDMDMIMEILNTREELVKQVGSDIVHFNGSSRHEKARGVSSVGSWTFSFSYSLFVPS